jgi:hypothetical protein
MTAPAAEPRTPGPQPSARLEKPKRRWWPDTGTPWGAVLYAVIGGLIVWLLVDVLPHVHIHISFSWH